MGEHDEAKAIQIDAEALELLEEYRAEFDRDRAGQKPITLAEAVKELLRQRDAKRGWLARGPTILLIQCQLALALYQHALERFAQQNAPTLLRAHLAGNL